MAKERLSKLQKWILNRCLENKENGIIREEIREFFGKKLSPKRNLLKALQESTLGEKGENFNWDGRYFSPKKELVSTRSIEASISRSFNNLIRKGFITDSKHYLTEKGFLSVNKNKSHGIVNTYKDYTNNINKKNEEREKYYKKFVEGLPNQFKKRAGG